MNSKRIIIIEDDTSVAKGLKFGLEQEGFEVFWAPSGRNGLSIIEEKNPHILILDIRLPDMSGYDICRKLRQDGRTLPILMLTASDEETDKVLGLELGADDYVVKPYSFRELVSRVRALLRRSYGELTTSPDSRQIYFGDIFIDMSRLQVFKKETEILLTPLEFKLLKYMVQHPNRPVSREALIEAVWGYNTYVGDERTVDVHIRHLREKLEQDPSHPCFIRTVRGFGYKFVPVKK